MTKPKHSPELLSAMQEFILDELMAAGRPLSKTALENALVKPCHGLVQSLDALEQRGYVQSAEANGDTWWLVTTEGEAAAIAPNPAVWGK